MAPRKVIIFGPTGAVGSSAARTAADLGAHVVLAMRDTSKPIPKLSETQEKAGNFSRVRADLTDPESVSNAVSSTGAKYAFIYLAHGAPDNMKATIQALKDAGIEMVAFLSSFTVQGDRKAIPPSEIISYMHAQVEINLEEIFGKDGFVAARAGAFASNTSQYKSGLAKNEVKIHRPEAILDNIVPEDIGRVCGTALANGPLDEQRIIYLFGPELMSQMETVQVLAKVLGKDPKIEAANQEEIYKMYVEERGVPPPVAKYMIEKTEMVSMEGNMVFGVPVDMADLGNVEKYSGKKATTFEEWAEQNKHIFT